jgi:hypothetical protein
MRLSLASFVSLSMRGSQRIELGIEILPYFAEEAEKRLHLAKGRGVKGEENVPQVNTRIPQSRDQAALAVGI